MRKALIAGFVLTMFSSAALAAEYDNPNASPIKTPFSDMTTDTYDGYPLFRYSLKEVKFSYAKNGIYVHGEMDPLSRLLTYTVENNNDGTIVTRETRTTHSGYRMVRGTHDENLFVLSFRR